MREKNKSCSERVTDSLYFKNINKIGGMNYENSTNGR